MHSPNEILPLLNHRLRIVALQPPSPLHFSHSSGSDLPPLAYMSQENPDFVREDTDVDEKKSDNGDEVSGSNSILQAIAGRLADGSFPAVLVSEIAEGTRVEAQEALSSVQRDDQVRIQHFMDTRYNNYRLGQGSDDTKGDSTLRAEWALSYYYLHLISWIAQENRNAYRATFLPLVPPALLSPEKQQRAKELLSQLGDNDQPPFAERVHNALSEFLKVLPSTMAAAEKDILRDAWFQERYYAILEEFLAQRAPTQFVPLLAPDRVDESRRAEFHALCSKMRASDADAFHGEVEKNMERVLDDAATLSFSSRI